MNTYYATTEQATTIQGNVITAKCTCGESYAILVDDQTKVIICDSCHDNSSKKEQYL
jgi:hypothetical protein